MSLLGAFWWSASILLPFREKKELSNSVDCFQKPRRPLFLKKLAEIRQVIISNGDHDGLYWKIQKLGKMGNVDSNLSQ